VLPAFAQFDNDQKSERTKAGMRAALDRGRWTWQAPLGYSNGNAKIGEPSLVVDVERGAIITRAFEMVGCGNYSMSDVLKTVTALGLKTRKGRPLTPQTFGAVLKNPVDAGIIDAPGFGLKDIPGDFAPLASEVVFQRVEAVLSGHSRPATRHLDNPVFPLRCFVACVVA